MVAAALLPLASRVTLVYNAHNIESTLRPSIPGEVGFFGSPAALARFYADLLGWPIGHQGPATVVLAAPGGSGVLTFGTAPGPPHLEFRVDDLDAAVAAAVALGATLPEHQPRENTRTLVDPSGTPFSLHRTTS